MLKAVFMLEGVRGPEWTLTHTVGQSCGEASPGFQTSFTPLLSTSLESFGARLSCKYYAFQTAGVQILKYYYDDAKFNVHIIIIILLLL